MSLTLTTVNEHTIVCSISCHTPAQSPRSLPCQRNQSSTEVRVVFLKPVHAVRLGSGPPGSNYGPFKAKPNSYHMHITKSVHGRMSSVGTFHFEVDLKPRTRNKERKKCVQHLSSPATLVSTFIPLQPGQLTESFHAKAHYHGCKCGSEVIQYCKRTEHVSNARTCYDNHIV